MALMLAAECYAVHATLQTMHKTAQVDHKFKDNLEVECIHVVASGWQKHVGGGWVAVITMQRNRVVNVVQGKTNHDELMKRVKQE
jgi:hypothetical protein